MAKVFWAIPAVLVAVIYVSLGVFIGFFAKTSMLFGILFILAGIAPLALMYYPEPLHDQRKRVLWALGLGYLVLAVLGGFDDGTFTALEWLSLLLALLAGGLVVLSVRKVVPQEAQPTPM